MSQSPKPLMGRAKSSMKTLLLLLVLFPYGNDTWIRGSPQVLSLGKFGNHCISTLLRVISFLPRWAPLASDGPFRNNFRGNQSLSLESAHPRSNARGSKTLVGCWNPQNFQTGWGILAYLSWPGYFQSIAPTAWRSSSGDTLRVWHNLPICPDGISRWRWK